MEIDKCAHGSVASVETLQALPENQAGPGRHKCASCALRAGYEAGFHAGINEGYREGLESALDLIESHGLASVREKLKEHYAKNPAPPKRTPVHSDKVLNG